MDNPDYHGIKKIIDPVLFILLRGQKGILLNPKCPHIL
jgi:hypothetical protein